MSRVVWVFVATAVASLLMWPLLRPLVDRPRWRRSNYRGMAVAGVGGLVMIIVSVLSIVVVLTRDVDDLDPRHGRATLLVIMGFGLLGFVDDVGARSGDGGFGGHLRALLREGRVTTGLAKLVGGALLGVLAVAVADTAPLDEQGYEAAIRVVRGGAIVALGANLLNLFDRAPVRATKVGLLWSAALLGGLALWGGDGAVDATVWAAAVVGATVGLAPTELRERHMQGDTGVNAMGSAIGLATVLTVSTAAQWLVLAVLLVLNLLSERVSFTSVIDQVPPLRWFDRLGSPYRT